MGTLLLKLIGPMQSWGVQSHFAIRDTGLEPSKSGVVGLLCAAMGIDREDTSQMLPIAALRMGVRADREGLVKYDYHTAGKDGYWMAKGKVEKKKMIVSYRYYLADAAFLVGLEGDEGLLNQLDGALRHPAWPLFLGRKAFVPSEPVWLENGLTAERLETALENYRPRLRPSRDRRDDGRVRVVIEDALSGSIVRPDQPLSFTKGRRKFDLRRVRVDFIPSPPAALLSEEGETTEAEDVPLTIDA